MRKIELKIWPEYFRMILFGEKSFEVRKNDHDFKVGDVLCLKEWDPVTEAYSGRETEQEVTYILPGGQFGIEPDFCIMSIKPAI